MQLGINYSLQFTAFHPRKGELNLKEIQIIFYNLRTLLRSDEIAAD